MHLATNHTSSGHAHNLLDVSRTVLESVVCLRIVLKHCSKFSRRYLIVLVEVKVVDCLLNQLYIVVFVDEFGDPFLQVSEAYLILAVLPVAIFVVY